MKRLMLGLIALTALLVINVRAQGAGEPTATASPVQAVPKAGVEILSDTMGVDFSPYLRRLHNDIQRNWGPLIPAEAKAPEKKKGISGIRITILPDGRIGSMKLETTSGDVNLDKASWYAITSENVFPALPHEFHGPNLELRIGFFYNVPIPVAK